MVLVGVFTPKCWTTCAVVLVQVPLHDYDPMHFLRCHFNDKKAIKNGHHDDDPTDELTNVWYCAMEPNPQNAGREDGAYSQRKLSFPSIRFCFVSINLTEIV